MYYQTTYKSPVGTLFLVSDEEKEENTITYTVQKGDSLYQIAKEYNTDYNLLDAFLKALFLEAASRKPLSSCHACFKTTGKSF